MCIVYSNTVLLLLNNVMLKYLFHKTGNCTGWIVYSYLIQVNLNVLLGRPSSLYLHELLNEDFLIHIKKTIVLHFLHFKNWFIFWANAPGFIISIWLNMAAAKLQYCDRLSHDMRKSVVDFLEKSQRNLIEKSQRNLSSSIGDSSSLSTTDEKRTQQQQLLQHKDVMNNDINALEHFNNLTKLAVNITIQKTEAPAPHEKIVVSIVAIWLTLITIISFVTLKVKQRELVIGIAVNINISFFFGAPLSTIYTVMKERNSSSIHVRTMVMNTLCALFFMAFGFGIWDYILIIPNAIGVVLGIVQVILRWIIPSKSGTEEEEDDDKLGNEEAGLGSEK